MSILKIRNIDVSYENERILKEFSLSIESGEYIIILGANGSGKSTFIKTLSRLLLPDTGEVLFQDTPIFDIPDDVYARSVGTVFQNPDTQFVASTVEADIAFGLENQCVSRNEMIDRVEKMLDRFELRELRDAAPSNLSGGQKQRVALASQTVMNPEVILLDEALSMVFPSEREHIRTFVRELHQEGKTVISVTHELEEIFDATRVLVFQDGMIVFDGEPMEIMTSERFNPEALGLSVPLSIELSKRFGVPYHSDLIKVVEQICP